MYKKVGRFSSDYYTTVKVFRCYEWYDIVPYSITLWTQIYKNYKQNGITSWSVEIDEYASLMVRMVISGSMKLIVNGKSRILRPGDILVLNVGSSCILSNDEKNHVHTIQLSITGALSKFLPEHLMLKGVNVFNVAGSEFDSISLLVNKIGNIIASKNEAEAYLNTQYTVELLLVLAELNRKNSPWELPEILTRAINIMNTDFSVEPSLDELVSYLKVSKATLLRLFTRHFGATPISYWQKLKMHSARQLLVTTDISIKELAVQYGFKNQFYFSTVFRRYYGTSPREYRRKRKDDTFAEL